MKKSIMMLVMALVMCVTFADVAKAATEYGVTILGEKVTSDNMSGNGWRYEPAASDGEMAKLYLTNANMVADASKTDVGVICSNDPLEVVLVGTNTIRMTGMPTKSDYVGIGAGDLKISGSGSLNIISSLDESAQVSTSALISGYELLIDDGVTINIQDGNAEKEYACDGKFGIFAPYITIGSNVKLNIEISGKYSCDNHFGLACIYNMAGVIVGDNCNIVLDGSKVTNAVENGYVNGFSGLQLSVGENTTVDIDMGNSNTNGIHCGYLNIGKDSVIKAYGGTKGIWCYPEEDQEVVHPAIGGSKIGDAYDLTTAIDPEDEDFMVFMHGNNIAKYVEIGPLLTINLKCDNGTVNKTSFTMHNGHAVGTLPTPVSSRKDYVFTGWYTAKTGGTKVYSTTKLTKSMTLYAQWKKITYNITLNANGGSVGTSKIVVEYDGKLGTLPTPTRTGYTFTGWYTAKTGGTKVYSTTKPTKSMTLYAQWKIKTYTINFDGNGGTVGVEKKWVDHGNAMEFMPTPKRSGYTFTGWYTAKTGGSKVYSTTKVTKNMTLYAQWKANTYTITFDGNGGTVGVTKKWVNAGDPIEFMPTPKRDGYTFTGWYTAASGGTKVYSTTKPTKNMALYAQWKKK